MKEIIVIGSGIAALSLVHRLDESCRIICITKDTITKSNSYLAQGGVCYSRNEDDDGYGHIKDTYLAGCELADYSVVEEMILRSHKEIYQLIVEGCAFDTISGSDTFDMSMEGAHSISRIIHAGGDCTGSHIINYLINRVKSKEITYHENTEVIDFLIDSDGVVSGVLALDDNNVPRTIRGDAIVIASGGYSNVYRAHSSVSNDVNSGHILAFHYGSPLRHMEMIQFHPTLLGNMDNTFGLVSEAVRGHGGVLVNEYNEPIMKDIHCLGSLAPRDITSRAIFQQQKNAQECFIDISNIEQFPQRFPSIYGNVMEHFPEYYSEKLIPITVGAHYTMGGIKSKINDETNLSHVYAIGEVSNTNFHGANRLASNSLLEGLVMGASCAASINQQLQRNQKPLTRSNIRIPIINDKDYKYLSDKCFEMIGIERANDNMASYLQELRNCLYQVKDMHISTVTKNEWHKYVKLKTLELICLSALNRGESRGAHYRKDFPVEREDFQNIDIELYKGEETIAKYVKCPREIETILHRR